MNSMSSSPPYGSEIIMCFNTERGSVRNIGYPSIHGNGSLKSIYGHVLIGVWQPKGTKAKSINKNN